MNDIPSIFIIFGMTGDLTALKIIPALWDLFQQDMLPKQLVIIGFSRRDLSQEDLRTIIIRSLEVNGKTDKVTADFETFFDLFVYHQGTFEDSHAFVTLAERIHILEQSWGVCANKLFYLAVPPSSYEYIFKNLAVAELNMPCGGELGWSRIMIEKPFGVDLVSAQKLQVLLALYFKEEQIYRIDHYLFKGSVEKRKNISEITSVHVRFFETVGVENRGGFYDAVGALRDVGQNHMLSMLTVLVGGSRAAVLQSLRPWTESTLRTDTQRAQYSGYTHINGVRPDSQTETYFLLKTKINNSIWKNIPIYIEGGKRMGEMRKDIEIVMKDGTSETVHFDGIDNAYAKVIRATIIGDQTLFVSKEEVQAAWKFIDPVVASWQKTDVVLGEYDPGTTPGMLQ